MEGIDSLKYVVPYHLVFYPFSISCLKIAASGNNSRSISRILNALMENGYETIGDILEATSLELLQTRSFGPRGLELVTSLLIRIYEHPELISDKLRIGKEIEEENYGLINVKS